MARMPGWAAVTRSIDLQCVDEPMQHVRPSKRIDRDTAGVIPDPRCHADPLRHLKCPRPVSHPLNRPADLDMKTTSDHAAQVRRLTNQR